VVFKSPFRFQQPRRVRFRGNEFAVPVASADGVSLTWETSLWMSTTLTRPAPAMLETAAFQPSKDCERALRHPLNRRKPKHYTTLRSSVVHFGSFCGVRGGFFKKSPF